MKARELANVRRLAHEVLLQRSDVETFLVSSIRQVRPTCLLTLLWRHLTSDLCKEEQALWQWGSGEVQQMEGHPVWTASARCGLLTYCKG